MTKKILIASDHGGFHLKKAVCSHLQDKGYTLEDLGCHSESAVDYPDFASLVASRVSAGEVERGVLVCGTGVGMAISANKFSGVRAASIGDIFSARLSREHNDLNVLCLGGRMVAPALACAIVDEFLKNNFGGDRHQRRLDKIIKLEKENFKSCP